MPTKNIMNEQELLTIISKGLTLEEAQSAMEDCPTA
jgi:hypothetical protein